MNSKIKTSILIDEELWRKIKLEATVEGGLKGVSKLVEEALEEELSELAVAKALENMAPTGTRTLAVTPVKPKVKASAGEVIRKLRESAA
jgi:hypothetical protein